MLGINGYLFATDGLHTFPFGFHEGVHKHFPYVFKSSVIAVIVFLLYSTIVSAFVYFGFEKTASDEMIFFLIFLVCTSLEGTRLFFPDQKFFLLLQKKFGTVYPATGVPTTSTIFVGITKLIIFSRSMAFISLFLISFYPLIKRHVNTEELMIANLGISTIITVNSRVVINDLNPTFVHSLGGKPSYVWAMIFLFSATFLLTGNYLTQRSKKRIPESIGYFAMINGFVLLTQADSYFVLIFATVLLFAGTLVYLKSFHTRLNN